MRLVQIFAVALFFNLPSFCGAVITIDWSGDAVDASGGTGLMVDALDDTWRSQVVSDFTSGGLGAPVFEHPDMLLGTSSGSLKGTSTAFSNGVMFDYTLVNTTSGALDAGTAHSSATASWAEVTGNLQDSAPVPSIMTNYVGITESAGSSAAGSLNGVLFEFSTPLNNFGIFLGDVESRSSGTLGELRLFDATNNLLLSQQLFYSGVVNGVATYTESDDAGSTGNNNTLNRWGDDQTSFVGFSASNGDMVSKMLVVVGDDDFGNDGRTEHLSFIGATTATAVPEPSAFVMLGLIGSVGVCVRYFRNQRGSVAKNE